MGKVKKIVFSIISLLCLALFGELLLRAYYFQRLSSTKCAIVQAVNSAINIAAHRKARNSIRSTINELGFSNENDMPLSIRNILHRSLYSSEGSSVLSEFRIQYEESFSGLIADIRSVDSIPFVLYMPSDEYTQRTLYRRDKCRQFYSNLCAKLNVDFLDVTDKCLEYRCDWVTLLPRNGHFSRFGNQLVASELADRLGKYKQHRSGWKAAKKPVLYGDLEPGSKIWEMPPEMPYFVQINSQGLRMDGDITFPKTKQRILCLGDSFTFGPYLENHDCYPQQLEAVLDDTEVINGGVSGYTITDEAGMFSERAKYLEPDITVIQVLDNDLYDMFFFQKNTYARDKRGYAATPEETILFKSLKKNQE